MSKTIKKNNQEGEINITDFIYLVTNGYWKILVLYLAIPAILFFAYINSNPSEKIFKAKTIIKDIPEYETNRFIPFNTFSESTINNFTNSLEKREQYKFFQITPSSLKTLYINQLEKGEIFKEAFEKFKIIDKAKFDNEESFNRASNMLFSKIKFDPPFIDNKQKVIKKYWTVEFRYIDPIKWREILIYVDRITSKQVKIDLEKQFQVFLDNAKQKHRYNIEDVTIKIANAIQDFDKKTNSRLAFLYEQAAIARTLEIKTNSYEDIMISSAKGGMVINNVKPDAPFYLRGYDAIEKEIDLILARTNKKAFISQLIELESIKRDLLQNNTISRIENIFYSAFSDIKRLENFNAAKMEIGSTKFIYDKDKTNQLFVFIMFLSFIFGLIHIFFLRSINNNR